MAVVHNSRARCSLHGADSQDQGFPCIKASPHEANWPGSSPGTLSLCQGQPHKLAIVQMLAHRNLCMREQQHKWHLAGNT